MSLFQLEGWDTSKRCITGNRQISWSAYVVNYQRNFRSG